MKFKFSIQNSYNTIQSFTDLIFMKFKMYIYTIVSIILNALRTKINKSPARKIDKFVVIIGIFQNKKFKSQTTFKKH